MKIAIVGMGVAGSYLINQLSRTHDVVGFDRYPEKAFECVCAWGTTKKYIERFAGDCEIRFDHYILHEGREAIISVGGVESENRVDGLVCFDKHGFFEAMRQGRDVRYGTWIKSADELRRFNLVVDATGLRVLLPRIREHEVRIPCVQYRIKYRRAPFDDFYIRVLEGLGGYLWYFPLGHGVAHVGAGDINHRHSEALDEFFSRYGGEKQKLVGRPLRICPPKYCQPFRSGKVVGVGESIGTVFPLLGEGIIPSLECAELLVKHLDDLEEYRRQVLKRFAFFETVYEFLNPLFHGEVNVLEQARLLQPVMAYLRANQARYGIDLQPSKLTIEPYDFLQQAISFMSMITA